MTSRTSGIHRAVDSVDALVETHVDALSETRRVEGGKRSHRGRTTRRIASGLHTVALTAGSGAPDSTPGADGPPPDLRSLGLELLSSTADPMSAVTGAGTSSHSAGSTAERDGNLFHIPLEARRTHATSPPDIRRRATAQTQLEQWIATAYPDRYHLRGLLGSGRNSRVYLAHDRLLDRNVAIKVLGNLTDPRELHRFLRESRLLGEIDHPHVVRIYETAQISGRALMFMEYLAGGTLRRKMEEGVMPTLAALHILTGILDGLRACHARGIIHRDLKPENIILTKGNKVKIVDLGIAKIHDRDTLTLTNPGDILGSPLYMSPELLDGADAGYAADIFAVGVIAYELLSGAPPIQANSLGELLKKQKTVIPLPLEELRPDLPLPLTRCVNRALEKQADDRLRDTAAFLKYVRRAMYVERRTLRVPISRIQTRVESKGRETTIALILALFLILLPLIVLTRQDLTGRMVRGSDPAVRELPSSAR